MNTLDEYVEMRLHEWATWFKDPIHDNMLGYPHETIEYRLWKDGIVVKQKFGISHSLPINSRAEEIEKWVLKMQKYNPKQSNVIRLRYFTSSKIPIEALSRKAKMSRRAFEDYLRLAKNYIRGCVSVCGEF